MSKRGKINNVIKIDSVDSLESVECLKDKNRGYVSDDFSLGTLTLRLFHASSDLTDSIKHGNDIVYNLVQRKKTFQHTMDRKYIAARRRKFCDVFEKLERQMKKAQKNTCFQISKNIPVFLEYTKHDPDETFFGAYNWYYTGGCLQHFCFNDNNYLAYVGGRKKDNLYIAPLQYDPLWCIDKSGVQSVTATPEKEIFQVLCVEKSNHNFIGIRQRDVCLLYTHSENRMIKCFNFISNAPISSFDISSVHEELCVIDVNKGLTFCDIRREELFTTTYFPSDNPRLDNWHNLLYSADPSLISIAGHKSIKWMDRRSNNIVNSMKLSNLKEMMMDEEVSLHFASEHNPYLIYVSTNVNLFLLDIRSPVSTVKLWSHYLKSPPVYSSIIPYGEENEIICIGNQHPGNIVVTFNGKSDVHPLVKIPSLMDSLLSLQAQGLCLDPSVKPRMALGLTGLTCLKSNKCSNVELLTQTAGSDVFAHSLFGKSSEMNSDDLSGLVSTKEKLRASEKRNMSKFLKELSQRDIKHNSLPKSSRPTGKQPWQLSKQELLEYKDLLSPLILEEWEVDIINGKSSLAGKQKVSAWLDSSFNTVYTTQERYPSWEDE